jgi:DNA polymerase III gamma/tau subunit
MQDQVQTAESTAIARFVRPIEDEVIILTEGSDEVQITSDAQYQQAAQVLRVIRDNRKALTTYFKSPPMADSKGSAGEGLCYFARKAWDAANSLFNKFDARFVAWDLSVDGAMRNYRAEVERKAKAEAEAKAAEERRRLEADAKEQRAAAEAERKRLEAIAEEERRKAEEESQRRLRTEQAAAKSKQEVQAAQRRALEEQQRIEAETLRKKQEAEAQEATQNAEAELKEEEAQNVVAIVVVETPKSEDISIRKSWRAEVTDFAKLVEAAAANRALLVCLSVDQAGCDGLAKAYKGMNPPPGLKFVQKEFSASKKVK